MDNPKNPMEGTKVIGYVIINWESRQIACDLYEGNKVVLPSGKLGKASDATYEKLYAIYKESVQAQSHLRTAYAYNEEHGIEVPEYTADPKATEKTEAIQKREEEEEAKRLEREAAEAEERRKREEAEAAERERLEALERERREREEQEALERELEARRRRREEEERAKEEAEKRKLEEEQRKKEEEERKRLEAEAEAEAARKREEEAEAERKRLEEEAAQREKERQIAQERAKKEEDKKARQQEKEEARARKEADKEAARMEKQAQKEALREQKEKERAERAAAKAQPATEKKVDFQSKKRNILVGGGILLVCLAVYVGSMVLPAVLKTQDTEPSSKVGTTENQEEYVVIALAKDVPMSQMIAETDLKGVIVTSEQYEKYNAQTYIDASGDVNYMELLLWEDKDAVVGQYAASDLRADDVLYDTSITSQHVIADKTYVEATVNGEDGTYEISDDTLSGNTDIKIVAVITTDGGEPVQILLSQMTLQDRSLESIFNAAGQDILEQLSNQASSEGEQDTESEGASENEEAQEE